MKRCPKCYRANADEAEACVLCHESLAEVDASLFFDPDKDAAQWAKDHEARGKILKRDTIFAALLYAGALDFMVVVMGFKTDPLALAVYFASALVVAFVIARRLMGMFMATLLQGGLCVTWMVVFDFELQPMVFFLITGNLVLPMLLHHWVEGMRDMYR